MWKVQQAGSISLYLNLLISKLRSELASNSHGWVRSKLGISSVSSNDSQETQCLIGGGGELWIANNFDTASEMQMTVLNYLGITSKTKLLKHIEQYKTWVVNSHLGKVNLDGATSKQQVFCRMETICKDDAVCDDPAFDFDHGAAVSQHKLSSGSTPADSKIQFIMGNYRSTNAYTKFHAEQKLLAALKKYNKAGNYYINGCKMPCTTCRPVLIDAQTSLGTSNIRIAFADKALNGWRGDCGLATVTASDIAIVDLGSY